MKCPNVSLRIEKGQSIALIAVEGLRWPAHRVAQNLRKVSNFVIRVVGCVS